MNLHLEKGVWSFPLATLYEWSKFARIRIWWSIKLHLETLCTYKSLMEGFEDITLYKLIAAIGKVSLKVQSRICGLEVKDEFWARQSCIAHGRKGMVVTLEVITTMMSQFWFRKCFLVTSFTKKFGGHKNLEDICWQPKLSKMRRP